jgi:NAD+ synthase
MPVEVHMQIPELDTEKTIEHLAGWLREQFEKAGLPHAVIGLSGGIDSSVSAALTVRALGPENVTGILMPYRTSTPESVEDATALVEQLGIASITEEITPQIDLYYEIHADADPIRRGNKMARERMSILYDHSKRLNALVVGTGNRTEAMLGYTTMYGDNACALNPIGEFLKTEVRQLGAALSLPERILTKPPSADLWAGQTDEDELGLTYAEVDPLLVAMFDRDKSRKELIDAGFSERAIDRTANLVLTNSWKRKLPPVAPRE